MTATDANTHRGKSRNTWCPHVTVATILADADNRFLMVEENIRGRLRYNQPAGHLEPEETLIAAAKRETLEETGYDVRIDALVGVYQYWNPLHANQTLRFSFCGSILKRRPHHELDTGIVRTLWLTYADISALGEKLRGPAILASIRAWQDGTRLPLDILQTL